MDYSGLAAFLLSWLYVTVCLATRLLSNKSDIGEAAFGWRPTLVAYLQQQVGRRMDVWANCFLCLYTVPQWRSTIRKPYIAVPAFIGRNAICIASSVRLHSFRHLQSHWGAQWFGRYWWCQGILATRGATSLSIWLEKAWKNSIIPYSAAGDRSCTGSSASNKISLLRSTPMGSSGDCRYFWSYNSFPIHP